MTRRWRPRATLLAVFLAALAGCEPVVEPTSEPPFAPEVARQLLESDGTVLDEQGNDYTLVEGQLPTDVPTLSVSRLVDASGGSLRLAGHALTVPAGAVEAPTVFVLEVLPTGRVEVELRALVSSPFGTEDVGERGFDRPVSLTLSYAWARGVEDPGDLQILHLRDDGIAEPLATRVDPVGRTVTADLEHFSRYCMAIP